MRHLGGVGGPSATPGGDLATGDLATGDLATGDLATGDRTGEVTVVPADERVRDFASAAGAVLADLRARFGMDSWLVARRRGEEYVVLATASDDAFGQHPGLVRRWEDTFCARVLDGSAPVVTPVVDDVPALADMRAVTGMDVRSYLSVPLRGADETLLGVLCAAGTEPRGSELHQALPSVRVQADVLATLLDLELGLAREVRRRERAESAAATDALTGVPNRRAWDAALTAEEARAGRYATMASVVVLDLDALKDVNDASGHAAGDALLRRTADLLRERVRGSDLLARLGGDEFGLLLVETSPAEAAEVARQVRDLLAAAGVEASVGVGARTGTHDLYAAWRAADAAMYRDKSTRSVSPRRVPVADPATAAHRLPQTARVHLSSVDALLQLVREQLDMDAAYVTRFGTGADATFRNFVARGSTPLRVGERWSLDGSCCGALVDGRIESVVPDTGAHPTTHAMAVTDAFGVGAYVGVPLYRSDGSVYGTLCASSTHADHRLQQRDAEVLRSVGGVIVELVEEEDRREDARRAALSRLDALKASGGPGTALQVVVDLRDGSACGVEALSRFPEPRTSPSWWFARAAQVGATEWLDLLCLEASLAHASTRSGRYAVNVLPTTLLSPAFTRLLGEGSLDHLVVEVSEHERVEDYSSMLSVLRPLRERGLLLAVDDAGAGFNGLRHVVHLEPDVVKLDAEVVRGIERSTAGAAMAAAVVGLARSTGALVLAEGVETEAERQHLLRLGVALGQGHLFGRPELVEPAT
ncbi:EAL domain-containing protein [Pseudokineococcus sp. 1T1Z-3]|uniref:EAL domain-containing protein n=1 Tax=Pseudokineococcus sp. 1T1Z-3 TaxID=3132745 RepID=UPI0030A8AB53